MKLLCEKELQFQHNLNILQDRPRYLGRKRAWISRPLDSNAAQGKDICPMVVLHSFVRSFADKGLVMDRPIIQIALQIALKYYVIIIKYSICVWFV